MSKTTDLKRIKDKADFQRIIGHGHRIREMFVTLYYIQEESPFSRAGFSVTRGVKRAVDRNRLRRRTREVLRSLSIKPGYSLIFIIKGYASGKNFWQIREAMQSALARSGALLEEKDEQ